MQVHGRPPFVAGILPVRGLQPIPTDERYRRRRTADGDLRTDDVDVDAGRDLEFVTDRGFLRTTETRPEPLQRFQISVLERRFVAVDQFPDSARRICRRWRLHR